MSKLPEKPSDILRLAVEDARKLLRNDGFKLNMGVWAEADVGNNDEPQWCEACLAGCMVLGSFPEFVYLNTGCPDDSKVLFDNLRHDDPRLYYAMDMLDSIRFGHFYHAISSLTGDWNVFETLRPLKLPRYNQNDNRILNDLIKEHIGFVESNGHNDDAFLASLDNLVLLLKANML